MGSTKSIANKTMIQQQERSFNFALILEQFSIKGSAGEIKPYGSGHIHDTFHVINKDPKYPDYLLQRINHIIFKNIPELTENIQIVTEHLRKKLKNIPGADPDKEVLTVVLSKSNEGYYKDSEGNYWRMYYYITDTRSHDVVKTTAQAYEGGKAFGKFQALLADLDANLLHETIPDFHDIEHRLMLFQEAMTHDPKERVKEVSDEIAFVEARKDPMSTICRLGRLGKIPLRITHNDTKFNNVLLNSNDEAQCVIDLDTVMPGFVAYDFGDAIRTIVNKAPEDEKDLEKIQVDMELFRAFTRGFLEEVGGFMTKSEIHTLAHGALLLPFIIGLRFLTDYIDGDNYFKINFPAHNLQRARAQFRLVEKLEEHFEGIQDLVKNMATSPSQTEL